MRTNIVLNDTLVEEAFKYSVDIRTKKELVETALKEYVQNRKIKDLRELKGKIVFSEDYDYKKNCPESFVSGRTFFYLSLFYIFL